MFKVTCFNSHFTVLMDARTKVLDLIKSNQANNIELAEQLIEGQELYEAFPIYEELFDWLNEVTEFDAQPSEYATQAQRLLHKIVLILTTKTLRLDSKKLANASIKFPKDFNFFMSLKHIHLLVSEVSFETGFQWPNSLNDFVINGLNNNLLDHLHSCSNLERLAIIFDQADSLNLHLEKFPQLKALYFSFEELSELPLSISQLSNLKLLAVNCRTSMVTNYTEPLPIIKNLENTLLQIPQLKALYLNGIHIKDINNILSHLKQLKELMLNFLKLNQYPTAIQNLSQLESLDLCHNSILDPTEKHPGWLKYLPNLKTIRVD